MRYLVIELSADATVGGHHGKNADVTLYRTNDKGEAENLAARLNTRFLNYAQNVGGYPDGAWVLDTSNPKAFGDIKEMIHFLDEWDKDDSECFSSLTSVSQ
jgi:hypothetical protein